MTKILVDKLATLSGHRDSIYTLERSGTPSQFYSAAGDGMIVQWDLRNPTDGNLVVKVPNSVYAIKYVNGTNCLLVGQNFNGIHKIDLHTNQEITSAAVTKEAIFDIELSGDKVLVGTGDGQLIVLNYNDLSVVSKTQLSGDRIRSLKLLKDQQSLVIGCSDNTIKIVDLQKLQVKHELKEHTNSIFALLPVDGESKLISAGRDAHLKIWNTSNWKLEQSIPAHMYAINDIVQSPCGKYFATCSMDKSIKVWDIQTFKLLKVIDKSRHAGHGTSVNKLLWSEYNNYIVSGSDDRTISVWNLKFNE